MSRKFKNPPINELVIGVYFAEPIGGLRSEHVGVFWSSVSSKYPKIEQKDPFGGFFPGPGDVFPMPRFWLISEDETFLLQIQRNAFLLNWRKRDGAYPHFDSIKAEFLTQFNQFCRFIQSTLQVTMPIIGACELQYINAVEPNEYWQDVRDTGNVIPSFSQLDVGMGQLLHFNYNTIFRVDDDLSMSVGVRNLQSVANPNTPVLVFEIKADGGKNITLDGLETWFNRAHDATGETFLNLTGKTIQQKFWAPVEQ